jgi:8-amino-7-oxononanoate synthase
LTALSSEALLASLRVELKQRRENGLLRKRRLLSSPQGACIKVDGREVLSFCSNDYLGLANHPDLIAALQEAAAESGVGGAASHLITGHHKYHEQLERALAAYVRLPAALLFSTGYMANLGVVSTLMGRGDAVFADKLNHASLNDAAILSRAEFNRFPHNDLVALEGMLKTSKAHRKLVAVDAVFSMDGDLAPMPELLALCDRYDAWLMLDDAHGFGVLGHQGRGVLSHFQLASPRIIYMATLGKAAGVSGAFVAGETVLVEYLLQKARTYIYTTATPPAVAATVLAALKIIRKNETGRKHLNKLIAYLKTNLKLDKWQLAESTTAIQPLMIGSNESALALSEYLLTLGILVPAIWPPTVPNGTARLRITLSAAHSLEDVKRLITALQNAEKKIEA